MTWASIVSIALLLSACQTSLRPVAEYAPGGPGRELIARLEARVTMPAGAEPITSYLRTYYPNGDKIVGQYLLGSQTGIRSLPARDTVVMDGGCSVVTVQYDPTTDQAEETFCNGVA